MTHGCDGKIGESHVNCLDQWMKAATHYYEEILGKFISNKVRMSKASFKINMYSVCNLS